MKIFGFITNPVKKRVGAVNDKTSEYLRNQMGKLGHKWRLAGRIRLINRFAVKHPKATFGFTTGFLTLMLLITLYTGATPDDDLRMNDIVDVGTTASTYSTLQERKKVESHYISSLAQKAIVLKSQVDSLNNKKPKSPQDSALLISKAQELHFILTRLNKTNHDKD